MNPPPSRTSPNRWPDLACAAGLVAAVFAVYANSLGAPFLFDDGPAILRNQTIRSLWPPGIPLNPPLDGAGVTGRPLTNLSLAVNYAIGGLDVWGYHAMNVALHALAVLTLWGVLRRTLPRLMPAPSNLGRLAGVITLLWAVHPLLTESVVCVVQRNELLGGWFYLLTLYGFIRSTEADAKSTAWRFFAVAACLLGVASKEIVATAPLMVLLYDRTFVAGTFATAWRQRKGFYVALASTWLVLVWLMLGNQQRNGIVGYGLGISAWDYLLTQCRALTVYLKLAVWPRPLIADYGADISPLAEVWWRGLLILGLLGGTIWALRQRPVLGFIGAWFFVILAPSSSIVPLTTQTIAEHRMYLPLISVLVLVGAVIHRLAGNRPLLAGGLLAAILASGTVLRNFDYRSEVKLWSDLLAHQPANARVHASLGYALAREGRWEDAATQYAGAVRLLPGYADAHNDLGNVLTQLNQPAAALIHFREAHRLKPDDPEINFNLGKALTAAGQPAQTVPLLAQALRLDPGLTDARVALGRALVALDRLPDAVAQYRKGLKHNPDSVALRTNLADSLLDLGRLAEAAAAYERVLELQPELAAVRHNLALALVRLGRPTEAIPLYEQVLRQQPDSAPARLNYAIALEQCGRTAEAIRQDEAALQLDPQFTAASQHLENLRGK